MAVIDKNKTLMEFPLSIKRQYAGPIESNEIWFDLEALKEYAKNGATAYAGQTVKFIDESNGNKITVYTIQADGSLTTSGEAIHTHTPADIIETEDKKFVSQAEKDEWNSILSKVDTKIEELEKGRVWKPSVDTFEDISTTYPEPQDTWTVTAKDTNIIWQYDAEQGKWIDLGHSVVHDNATPEKDGMMSKEDKTKLDGLEGTIDAAKQELTDKVNALETKHGEDKTTLEGQITALTEAHNTDKAALEEQIAGVDSKFVAATDEQIDALFGIIPKVKVVIKDETGNLKEVEVEKGTQYTPEMPEVDGYVYEGLYKDADCTEVQEVPFELTESVNITVVKK